MVLLLTVFGCKKTLKGKHLHHQPSGRIAQGAFHAALLRSQKEMHISVVGA
jgi:hypothetical protein